MSDQRLTCNRIFRHIYPYSQQNFSGKLTVKGIAGEMWNIYLTRGVLTWATGGVHPKRRWRRQMYLVTGQTPDFKQIDAREECWDYVELSRLSGKQQLSPSQLSEVVRGTLAEIFFDIVQTFEQPLHNLISEERPLVPLKALTGIGDGMQVEADAGVAALPGHRFPMTWMPELSALQQQTQVAWKKWVQLGLYNFSPNLAPAIRNSEELRELTPEKLYRNLEVLLNGNRTIRDVALKTKQDKSQLSVARILSPYIRRKLVVLRRVKDLHVSTSEQLKTKTVTLHTLPLIVCVDSQGDRVPSLKAVAAQAGYVLETLTDSIEALYKLSRGGASVPDLVLLSDRLAPLSAPEFCQVLRRIPRWKNTAIAIYIDAERPDRKRAKRALETGANEYLTADELTAEKLLVIARSSVPEPPSAVNANHPSWRSAFATFGGDLS